MKNLAMTSKDLAKVRMITWRDKDSNTFMLRMEGRDPKFVTKEQHKELVRWMYEGLTPEECYERLE